jgi:hypothetical protein
LLSVKLFTITVGIILSLSNIIDLPLFIFNAGKVVYDNGNMSFF